MQNISNVYYNKEIKKDQYDDKNKTIILLEQKIRSLSKENANLAETVNHLKMNQEHEYSINRSLNEKLYYHD